LASTHSHQDMEKYSILREKEVFLGKVGYNTVTEQTCIQNSPEVSVLQSLDKSSIENLSSIKQVYSKVHELYDRLMTKDAKMERSKKNIKLLERIIDELKFKNLSLQEKLNEMHVKNQRFEHRFKQAQILLND
jgi:predicted RNase H-like nuclease (RuvC/YqgF family)